MNKKWIALLVCIVAIAAVVMMCGKKKSSIDGYYTWENDSKYGALIIKGRNVTYQTASNNYYPEYFGAVEKTAGGADLYFDWQGDSYSDYYQMLDYSPLHVKLSEDGKHLYLSSDNSKWLTDIYNRVSKKEYEEYYNENLKEE